MYTVIYTPTNKTALIRASMIKEKVFNYIALKQKEKPVLYKKV